MVQIIICVNFFDDNCLRIWRSQGRRNMNVNLAPWLFFYYSTFLEDFSKEMMWWFWIHIDWLHIKYLTICIVWVILRVKIMLWQHYLLYSRATWIWKERIPKKVVEKYKNDIIFHVFSNECMIEVVEPWTAWIQPLGYEIIKFEAKGYVQVLLKSPKATCEPRMDTYLEKSMEVHLEHSKHVMRKHCTCFSHTHQRR